jgi:kexin
MRLPLTVIMACIAHFSVSALGPARRYYTTHNYYVLEHDPRSGGSLKDVTKALGVEVVEQAGELVGHWIVRAEKRISGHIIRDAPDPVLRSLELLQSVATSPRSFSKRSEEHLHAKRVTSSIKYLSRQTLRRRTKRAPPPIPPPGSTNANSTSHIVATRLGIVDPLFDKQWHLINDEFPQHMMNVSALWDMGITGRGVITALVDDGLDYGSADLAANFVSSRTVPFFHPLMESSLVCARLIRFQ